MFPRRAVFQSATPADRTSRRSSSVVRAACVRAYARKRGAMRCATTLALRRGAPLRLEDQTTRRTLRRPLRRPTVAGSLDADEDDAVHFASAAICRLRVMPRAARACDAARRNQR